MIRSQKDTQRARNVTIRISPEERMVWTAAAQAQDRGLSSWLRWVANRETGLIRDPGRASSR